MSNVDIFNSDIFTMTKLTKALQEQIYVPQQISAMDLFEVESIDTTSVWIEKQGDSIALVPDTARGADGKVVTVDKRNARNFQALHLPQTSSVMADEVQNVRSFGSEDQTDGVQAKVNKLLKKHRRNLEYTKEYHKLGAVKGQLLNSDGSILVDMFTEFGVAKKTSALDLTNANYTLQTEVIPEIFDKVEASLDGMGYSGIRVVCGKSFWTSLINNSSVREAYLRYQSSANLVGDARMPFSFGGIEWVRYEGRRTAGASDVFVADGEALAIPMGVSDLFICNYAPANYNSTVNTMGLDYYAASEVMPFDKGMNIESQSNPLYVNTKPDAIIHLTVV